jgi:hypothetical protein
MVGKFPSSMQASARAMGTIEPAVRLCRNRSVAQNSAGTKAATSTWGQLVHMTMKPEPANAMPAKTAGSLWVPRRRRYR